MEDKPVKCPCTRDCEMRWQDCHKICPHYKAYEENKKRQMEKRKIAILSAPELTPKMRRYIAKKRRWK